jgi:hypothetical protein
MRTVARSIVRQVAAGSSGSMRGYKDVLMLQSSSRSKPAWRCSHSSCEEMKLSLTSRGMAVQSAGPLLWPGLLPAGCTPFDG